MRLLDLTHARTSYHNLLFSARSVPFTIIRAGYWECCRFAERTPGACLLRLRQQSRMLKTVLFFLFFFFVKSYVTPNLFAAARGLGLPWLERRRSNCRRQKASQMKFIALSELQRGKPPIFSASCCQA